MNNIVKVFALTLLALTSCEKNISETKEKTFLQKNSSLISEIKNTYAKIVLASYEDALNRAKELKTAVTTFANNPTGTNLKKAKEAWLASREPYGQTEAYRFSGGPIDDKDGPEGFINSWPLDESYIDYIRYNQESKENIINNLSKYPNINNDLLKKLNEAGGSNERSISTGYHAIEFLLWGQDTPIPEDGPESSTGGKRPYTDFVDGGTASNQNRRRLYLKTCTDLLVDNLQYLVDQWNTSKTNYRNKFLALSEKEVTRSLLSGITLLSGPELAGERIYVAVNNKSQEDEHSCFSDNTHRDIRLNFLGIKNVFEGKYTRTNGEIISGKSISDLAEKVEGNDKLVVTNLKILFDKAQKSLNATHIPFDYAVYNEAFRPAVETAAKDLQNVSDQLGLLAAAFGVGVYEYKKF